MIVFIEQTNPFVRLRFQGQAGEALLEGVVDVRIGEDFAGYSFEELASMGMGEHELEDKDGQ